MKKLLSIMIIAVGFTGCVFTPPVSQVVTLPDAEAVEAPGSVWNSAVTETDPLLRVAKKQLGVRYILGGASPEGFDCSGFVSYAYAMVGVSVPRTAYDQSTFGQILDTTDIFPGDILFFETSDSGKINHSGIYLGKGKFIHASSGRGKVIISTIDSGFYKDAFRWATRVEYQH
jgi:cell wall-associated NlpC family hydrolase